MDKLLSMSEKELKRVEVLQKLAEKRMRQREAADLLMLSVRQVKRLLKSYRSQGAPGLVSKRRGRPSNNQLTAGTRQKALRLLQSKYAGFGATLASEKVNLQFVQSESFFSYAQACAAYFQSHGKPLAFYSDKHGIFRVNQRSVGSSEALTQFGRAMQELQVEIIRAHTPQAKGRVERAILTLQDRLPKELRLRNLSSWDAGNAFLPEFIADFNQRFAVQPRSDLGAHRPLSPSENLTHILTWQETRTLSKNLTLQFRKNVCQIQTPRPTYALRHAAVTVCLDAQDRLSVFYKSKPLAFSLFQQKAKQSDIVDTK